MLTKFTKGKVDHSLPNDTWTGRIQFIFQGKFSHFIAILKAHASFYSLLSDLQRETIQLKKL
jgi:hypothetical protein